MISVYFPKEPDEKHCKAAENFWNALALLYPCNECGNELLFYLRYPALP